MASRMKGKNQNPVSAKSHKKGVMLEDIDQKLDIVIEAQQGLATRQENLEYEFSEFRSETKENFKTLFQFRDETRENFKTIFQYLSRLDDELAEIKKELAEIRSTLSLGPDTARVEALESRVHQLEIELAHYKKNIS